MNLSTIKKNIETGEVRTTAEFQRDMMLMFTNAIMYNNSDHNVYHMAVEMYNDVMVHIEVSTHGLSVPFSSAGHFYTHTRIKHLFFGCISDSLANFPFPQCFVWCLKKNRFELS